MNSLDQFIIEHGGPPVQDPKYPVWYLRDGAYYRDGGVTYAAPAEPRERLRAQRRYLEFLLRRAEHDAIRLEGTLNPGAFVAVEPWRWPGAGDWFRHFLCETIPTPPYNMSKAVPLSNDKRILLRLRGIVSRSKKAIASIDSQLAALVPAGVL